MSDRHGARSVPRTVPESNERSVRRETAGGQAAGSDVGVVPPGPVGSVESRVVFLSARPSSCETGLRASHRSPTRPVGMLSG